MPCSGGFITRKRKHRHHYIEFVAVHAVPKAMFLEEIKCATLEDATLQEVASRIRSGQWNWLCPTGEDAAALSSFHDIKDELILHCCRNKTCHSTHATNTNTSCRTRRRPRSCQNKATAQRESVVPRHRPPSRGTVERWPAMISHNTHQNRSPTTTGKELVTLISNTTSIL